MKIPLTAGILSLLILSSVQAEDWSDVPSGKARIVLYANFSSMGFDELTVKIDDNKDFTFHCTRNNLVLDLAPGWHSIHLAYKLAFGGYINDDAMFNLTEGYVGYWEYWVGRGQYTQPMPAKRFEGIASKRPPISPPAETEGTQS